MRIATIGFMLAICLTATAAVLGQDILQPKAMRQAGFDYYRLDDEQAEDSPSDAAVNDDDTSHVVCDAPCSSCDDGCDSSCGRAATCRRCCAGCRGGILANLLPCYCTGEPWTLFPNNNCRGITVNGWINFGVTTTAHNPINPPPPGFGVAPITFNYLNDEFMLNQAYTVVEKATETYGCGWDIGWRVDYLAGPDYIFTQAVGLETHDDGTDHWNSGVGTGITGGARYGIAMPQAYLELAYNDLKVKLGHFYTIIGYEVVPAAGNFFYSRAYTMQYGEPFTHSGALATWEYSDRLTLHGSVVNRWDTFDATTDRAQIFGGARLTSCDGRTSLGTAFVHGEDGPTPNIVDRTRTIYSIVLSHQFNDRLEYVIQHDGGIDNLQGSNVDQEWYGINQYLFYTINDCWQAGARIEWFRDDDGTRVNLFTPAAGEGSYYEATVGLNWRPRPNITIRNEARWDWYRGMAGVMPYANGTRTNQFTAAVDAIITY